MKNKNNQHNDTYFCVHLVLRNDVVESHKREDTDSVSSDLKFIEDHSKDYFIGIGRGSSPSKKLAIKIAKTKALGELNGQVQKFKENELTRDLFKSLNLNIAVFSDQTADQIKSHSVQDLQYETQNLKKNKSSGAFSVKVTVKKTKIDFVKEAIQKKIKL